MKIINTLFCLFLIVINSCNSNDHDTLKNKNKLTELQQAKNGEKHDSGQIELQQEIPKSPEELLKETPKSPEELLKEKLSEDQKIHLDWLKTALTNAGEFDKFLQYDVSKIKTALDHIKTELNKCKGRKTAAQQENIFKEMVKGALSGGDIDQIQQALSLCDILP
ncbi:Mlp family lipoprotein (plasmid) [Borreliella yangtzensis]|uniref:Vacuolar-type H+-ATPase subunit I/STV1 n=1 Tax=Borreliella yangtzensis TaxID=683292 RepID=A0ABR6PB56_9SPIR|nr:vacuolar-type H+-ATPase subunit I/STV1 [Borreliella yangtzensis]